MTSNLHIISRLECGYESDNLSTGSEGNNIKKRLTTLVLLASTTPLAAQWLTLPTPGVPRTAGDVPDLSVPTPRTADGHPDLSGLWRTERVRGDLNDRSKFQAWVRTLLDERESRFFTDNPRFRCLPSGPGNLTNVSNSYGLRRIVQHPTMIAMLYNDGTYRQIFTDGRELEPELTQLDEQVQAQHRSRPGGHRARSRLSHHETAVVSSASRIRWRARSRR